MNEKLENSVNFCLKVIKIAFCVVTVLPLLYWMVSALMSNGMPSDKIQEGVGSAKDKIENNGCTLSGEFRKIGFSEKSFKEAIDGLKNGEIKPAGVPGHAILLMKDKEGQVTVVDNGYFGGTFGHAQMLYSKVLKDNNVNYVGINTGGNSCGQAVINIANALEVNGDGTFNFDKTAENLEASFVKKNYGSPRSANVIQQARSENTALEKVNNGHDSNLSKVEGLSERDLQNVKNVVKDLFASDASLNLSADSNNPTLSTPRNAKEGVGALRNL